MSEGDRPAEPSEGDDQTPDPGAESTSLAAKLNRLVEAARPSGGKPPSNHAIAEGVSALGEPISASFIGYLRNGRRDNPTKKHLEGIARYFGVSVAYFFDEEKADEIDSQLELLMALRDGDIRTVATRMPELRPETRRWLAEQMPAFKAMEHGASPSASQPEAAEDTDEPTDQRDT